MPDDDLLDDLELARGRISGYVLENSELRERIQKLEAVVIAARTLN